MLEGRASTLARLQSVVLDLALDPADAAFREDPAAYARARSLGVPHQDAFGAQRDRWRLYRELIRTALTDPLDEALPVATRLLDDAGAWQEALDAFLASRSVHSPYYRDLPATFVAWLANSRWGQDRWPFLLQLAHYEVLELEVVRHPNEPPPAGLLPEPAPDRVAVLDPAARNLAYGFAVQEATVEAPVPRQACAWLLCHRDREGAFRVLELTPHVSALLARSQEGQPLGPALEGLNVAAEEAFPLLRDLRDRGALLGFRPA